MAELSKRFDGQLEVSPPVTDSQLSEVPGKRGILALLGVGDAPIILLTAANVRARLRARLTAPLEGQRSRTVDLRSVTRKVVWRLTGGHFETDLEFFEAARSMYPQTYTELLGWRPGWFVRVDPADEYPHFARTRDMAHGAGMHLGPFPDGRSADRFIDVIQDAFDLCRHYRCLRQSPNAQPCAYAQMNHCLSSCDGTISMADYRTVIARAADFAAGRRRRVIDAMTERMKSAAEKLHFERAANVKSRLDRLADLDKPAYAHVAPLEEFRYILIQPSGTSRRARVFLANGGLVAAGGELDYPLVPAQLGRTVRRMAARARSAPCAGAAELWRMGLIAHYLFCSDRRRGLMLRWREELTAEQLGEAMEAAKDQLRLRAPKPRRKDPDRQKESN
jgi:excinuclease UvrABC nuclease subunit